MVIHVGENKESREDVGEPYVMANYPPKQTV